MIIMHSNGKNRVHHIRYTWNERWKEKWSASKGTVRKKEQHTSTALNWWRQNWAKKRNSLLSTNGNSFARTLHCTNTATESMQNGFVRRRRFMFMEFICTGRNKERWHSMKEIIGSHDPGMKMKKKKIAMNSDNNKSTCVPSSHPSNQAQEIRITLVALAML